MSTKDRQIQTGHDPTNPSSLSLPSLALLLCLAAANSFRIGCQLVTAAWSAVQITGRTESVGHVLLISSVANLALSPFIGALIDRCPSKKPLVIAGYFGISMCGASPLALDAAFPHVAPFSALAVATLLASVSGMIVACAMDYFVKLAIAPNERTRKLALINTTAQCALIAGTAFGGCLVSYVTWRDAFALIGLYGAALSAFCASLLPSLIYRPGVRSDTRQLGPALYLKHRHLLSIACCSALVFAVGQVTNTLLPAFMSLDLKLSGQSYSLVEAAWAVGALSASAALARVAKNLLSPLHHDLLVVLAIAMLLSFVPWLSALTALVAVHLALGIGFAFVRVRSEARFLTECPTHLLARFRANSLFLSSSISALVFITPTVCRDFSVATLYQLLSGTIAASALALIGLARPWRAIRSVGAGG